MTATGWLAIAAAVAVIVPPRGPRGRIAALAGAGRLSGVPVGAPRRARREVGGLRRVAAPALGVAIVGVLLARGIVLAGAAGAAAAAGRLLIRDAVTRKQRLARQRDLRIGLRVLIGELEAGARPSAALAAARDAAPLHADAFGAAAGAPPGSAGAGAALLARPETHSIGLAWQLGADAGMALTAVLDRVAADLRADQEHRRTVEAVLAGPRASALLLAGLPLVGIALGAAMGARPLNVLTATPSGQLLCLVGVLLDVAGLLWMRCLLGRAERA
jgi:tight adherence protein B